MPRKPKKATAQDQQLLFKEPALDTLEELVFGDTKMRLVASPSGKSTYIQLWSSLSKCWRTSYRYEVEKNWNWWKSYASVHNERELERTNANPDPKPKRKRRVVTKKSGVDASPKRTQNRSRNRKSAVKNG